MKEFSKIYELKALITLKMTDLITLLDNNVKMAVYIGRNIHGLYYYLEMIRTPNTLKITGQHSNNFGPLSSTNNDITTHIT